MSVVVPCHWCPTGYGYADSDGRCTCRVAAPPGVILYKGERAALEHNRDVAIAQALGDCEQLAELEENCPPQHEAMLASALAKLKAPR